MGNCVGGKGPKKDPKILTEDEIKLLLDNTRLTRPQINALHQNFLKECPTGKLTKKDFVKLFKEVHPSENKKEKADKFCEYVFKVIDQQNLGYISFQEFVLCFSLTSDGDFKDKCEFAFRLYDLDKDGKISKKEMTQVLTALYDLSGITDRKGDKAPAKKVEEIMKKINATNQPEQQVNVAAGASTSDAASAPAAAPQSKEDKKKAEKAEKEAAKEAAKKEKEKEKEKKKEKDSKDKSKDKDAGKKDKEAAKKENKKEAKEKPAKEAKPAKEPKAPKAKVIDFITKDQFIDACSTDEAIKRLFVDSIFSSQPAAEQNSTTNDNNTILSVNTNDIVNIKSPSINISTPTVNLNSNNSNNRKANSSSSPQASPSRAAAGVTVNAPTLDEADIKNLDRALELNKSIITTTTTIDLHENDPNVTTSVTTNTNIQQNNSNNNVQSNENTSNNTNNNSNNKTTNDVHDNPSLASDSELWQTTIIPDTHAVIQAPKVELKLNKEDENNNNKKQATSESHYENDPKPETADLCLNINTNSNNTSSNEINKLEPGSVEINTSTTSEKQKSEQEKQH